MGLIGDVFYGGAKGVPKAEPKDALADSVTVRAGIVAVKQWMAEGKGKGQTP